MNGLIRRTALGTCLGATVAILAGCVPEYRELVDPCWPERYSSQARHSVRDAFNAQAANGHALDQTIFAEYFDVKNNTDLNQLGQERLKYIALRRPAPDPRVFVQKSGDAMVDSGRKESVEKYLEKLRDMGATTVTFDVQSRLTSEQCLKRSPRLPSFYQQPDLGTAAPTGTTGAANQGATQGSASSSSGTTQPRQN